MSHSRNDFSEFKASTLTSCSSEASVELYEEKLKPGIDVVRKSRVPLQELAGAAEKIINEIFVPDPSSTYKYKKNSEEISVELDKVMIAMLACAEECGGESGKRYVASAILACSKEEDVVGALAALGTTWLTHLLFIFKTSRSHGNQPNKVPSGIATPTVDKTATHLLEGVGNRKKSFPGDVMLRDGYTPRVRLVGAHILRRAIGEFDNDHNSKSVGHLSIQIETLEELRGKLDDPSNGITLQKDAHDAFDSFYWCLKRTEVRFMTFG
ncbi:hypothetical protein AN958_05806 [Leucoagaricus sp. SymC.cos]|nr:hypothetical protein AN958_05806 [Leucoagaricus sp. SymC.cos]